MSRAGSVAMLSIMWLHAQLASGCADDAPVDGRALPIVGGVDSPDDSAVVFTVMQSGFACSGTLIAPNVVLTAAHCIIADVDDPRGRAFFGPGSVDGEFDDSVDIINVFPHRYYDADDVRRFDIGLILLDENAPADIEPMPWAMDPIGDVVSRQVRVVGYGVTDGTTQEGAGLKRQMTLPVSEQTEEHLVFGSSTQNICQGDSGGPTLLDIDGVETVVAVSSFGSNMCRNPSSVTRTDTYAAAILPALDAWSGPCPVDGQCVTEGCRTPDPDCDLCGFDGFCKPDCAEPDLDCPRGGLAGDLCGSDFDCESRRCVPALDDPRLSYCSASCDTADACGAPLSVCSGGACHYDGITPSALGSPCDADDQCRSRVCDLGPGICVEPCAADGSCPEGFSCEAFGAGTTACTLPEAGCCNIVSSSPGRNRARDGAGIALVAFAVGLALARRRVRRRTKCRS